MSKPCFVYLFGHARSDGIAGPVKVGISENPDKRLVGVSTSCPYPVVKICHLYAHDRVIARAIEAQIHDDLAEHRINGEWFEVTPLEAVRALLVAFREGFEALGFTDEQFFQFAHSGSGIAEVLEKYTSEQHRIEREGGARE